jgi:hypothetical protein
VNISSIPSHKGASATGWWASPSASTLRGGMAVSGQTLLAAAGQILVAAHVAPNPRSGSGR